MIGTILKGPMNCGVKSVRASVGNSNPTLNEQRDHYENTSINEIAGDSYTLNLLPHNTVVSQFK
jgi:hypothetical protein